MSKHVVKSSIVMTVIFTRNICALFCRIDNRYFVKLRHIKCNRNEYQEYLLVLKAAGA